MKTTARKRAGVVHSYRRSSAARLLPLGVAATLFTVAGTDHALGKAGGSLEERMVAADVIVLGRIASAQPADSPQMSIAQIDAHYWLKGTNQQKTIAARLYSAGAEPGVASLFLLQKNTTGDLSESYPVMRVGPELWPYLPESARGNVYTAVNHSVSEIVRGLRLHLMRVPGGSNEPLRVWLCFENVSDKEASIPFKALQDIFFQITSPNGKRSDVPLPKQNGPARDLKVPGLLTVCATGPTDQITLISEPKPGRYTVRAIVPATGGWPEELSVTQIVEAQ